VLNISFHLLYFAYSSVPACSNYKVYTYTSSEHLVMASLKLTASQAKSIYKYKNLKAKVQRCCSNIYFNRLCLKQGLIPKYVQIKLPYTSPASIITQKKTQITRLKEEIKFIYKRKDKLNEFLYRTHLQAAQEWG